jgi:hypothetical protein
LLLWKLQEPPRTSAEVFDAAKKLAAAAMPKRAEPQKDINHWGLEHYIAVAEHFAVIKGDTPAATKLAQTFRNLIHPGSRSAANKHATARPLIQPLARSITSFVI